MHEPHDAPRRVGRRRVLIAGALLLLTLFAGLELALLRSYREAGPTTRAFSSTTNTTTSIANVQRLMLRLQISVTTMSGHGDVARVETGRALLSQQVDVLKAYGGDRPQLRHGLAAMDKRLARFDRILHRSTGSEAQVLAAAPELSRSLRAAELVIKETFDGEEHALLGALSKTLRQRQGSQLTLAGIGAFVLLFALILALVMRRSIRSDFTRAYRALASEVDERKILEARLREQATQDPLTGLGNRLYFQHALEHALATRATGDPPIAVVYLDLDGFKEINDMFGHDAGDEVLLETARRLVAGVRGGDIVSRLGGDEFALMLCGADGAAGAAAVATRLVADVSRPTSARGHEVKVGASAGIALSDSGGDDAADLVRNADLAMYVVKNGAKGRVRVFEPEMRTEVSERRTLESELRHAIAGDGLTLHFQPVAGLDDGRTVGLEALVRWQHPRLGLLGPGAFLTVAGDIGAMLELGEWVLREACRTAQGWDADAANGAPWVSVNVAPQQLQHPTLLATVQRALHDSGLPPQRLVLEISEMVLLAEAQSCIGVLEQLRSLGVRIALDDFGTGYSSLSYLRFLPLDILKVDQCFVEALGGDAESRGLTSAIFQLAETIGLTAIAEGIETAGQLETLVAMGCRLGQGFHLARPMPADQIGTRAVSLLPAAAAPAVEAKVV